MTSALVSESISSLLSWPVGNLMNSDAIILEADKTLDEAIKLMKERNQRSVLATHLGEVVGMVSKTDILYKVTSEGKNPSKIRLREIMTSPVLAVNPQNTIKDAPAL
jgi:CBS domain-containing protein